MHTLPYISVSYAYFSENMRAYLQEGGMEAEKEKRGGVNPRGGWVRRPSGSSKSHPPSRDAGNRTREKENTTICYA